MGRETIRFIDSHYNTLFTILDGDNIKINYPEGDSRGTIIRTCKFLDECHTRIGNYDYHICEFAERMEAIGAKYEPEIVRDKAVGNTLQRKNMREVSHESR